MDVVSVFVIYRHLTGMGFEYRWRLRNASGRTLARSAAGYQHKADLERELLLVRESHPDASVQDLTARG
jgi:uncharacterized protein YegP (UPF0339 family)